MRHTVIIFILLSILHTAAGCTSIRELRPSEQSLDQVLKTGDHIVVYEDSGRILDIRYVLIDGDVLRGSQYSDGFISVAVELDRIERIELERISPGKTSLAIAGGIILAPIAAFGMGAALADEWQ